MTTKSQSKDLKLDKRLPPPKFLSKKAKEVWTETLESLPADYFIKADEPLLVAYMSAYAALLQAHEELAEKPYIMDEQRGRFYANPIISMIKEYTTAMGTLSTKLRLAPASRYNATYAGKLGGSGRARPEAPSKKPWDSDTDDQD